MNFDCKKDAPVKQGFADFSTKESLVLHRDLYMAPQGEILAAYAEKLRGTPDAQYVPEISPEALYRACFSEYTKASKLLPDEKIRDAAGGFFAHKCFFESLGDGNISAGAMMKLHKSFGSAQNFFARFENAAKDARGNGFLWLCRQKTNTSKLYIVFTKNNLLPPPHLKALICLDMWEHSLCLSEKNTRREYAAAFLKNADFTKLR